jgi:hypothetical protein
MNNEIGIRPIVMSPLSFMYLIFEVCTFASKKSFGTQKTNRIWQRLRCASIQVVTPIA